MIKNAMNSFRIPGKATHTTTSRPSSVLPGRAALVAFTFGAVTLAPLAARAEEVAGSSGNLSLWSLMQQGGWAMYPLGACSLVMFFLIFHCARETSGTRFVPSAALPRLSSLLETRNIEQAAEHLDASPSVLSRSMRHALQKARPAEGDANKAEVESSLSESLEHEENGIGQWIHYLNVVATVAPMIGLLGTVSGMIGAFQTISAGGMGRPELLAGDIGQALVTTATGLMIGIPAMVAYFVLRNRLENRILATARSATYLVDKLAGELPDESDRPGEAGF